MVIFRESVNQDLIAAPRKILLWSLILVSNSLNSCFISDAKMIFPQVWFVQDRAGSQIWISDMEECKESLQKSELYGGRTI